MRSTRPRLVLATLALLGASLTSAAQSIANDLLGATSSWRTVVDGVMGGLSTGDIARSAGGNLLFTGNLRLENNGGFSQIRSGVAGDLSGAEGVEIRVRGDGRTYKFDVRCGNFRMRAGAYQKDFETSLGRWTTVRLPFDQFRAYSFGRLVSGAPAIDASQIESIGVTLADKKPGSFSLEIASIRPFGASASGGVGRGGSDLVSVAERAGLTTLLQLAAAADLELPPGQRYTIFAPTNDAFAAIPENDLVALLAPEARGTLRSILTFHATPGELTLSELLDRRSVRTLNGQRLDIGGAGGLTIGEAGVVAVDVPFDGGVIHVVDAVLMPELRSIGELASDTPDLSTLAAAVRAAGVADLLGPDNGPWTVFAPVNAAFESLPAGALDELLLPRNRSRLAEVLGVHVVPGRLAASDLLATSRTQTLAGTSIGFGLEEGRLTVEGATIIASDIDAANGVVHLIDSVLLPEDTPTDTGSELAELARLYETAVNRGAPLFNSGNPEACAAIYEVAVQAMIGLAPETLGRAAVDRLRAALAEASRDRSWTDKAWTLRRGLDDANRRVMSALDDRASGARSSRH
jgi:transforming growth factor-beta-induced protein